MQVTVSDKGQITLPQSLRKQLGIEPGSLLQVDALEDGSLSVRPLTRGAAGLSGLLHRPGRATVTLDDMDEAITSAAAQRDAGSRSGKSR
jgi:antitoxin PrlF